MPGLTSMNSSPIIVQGASTQAGAGKVIVTCYVPFEILFSNVWLGIDWIATMHGAQC